MYAYAYYKETLVFVESSNPKEMNELLNTLTYWLSVMFEKCHFLCCDEVVIYFFEVPNFLKTCLVYLYFS